MTHTYASMRKPGQGAGTDCSVRWACGHTHRGGVFKNLGAGRTPWRCQPCVDAAKAKKAGEGRA